MNIDFGGSNSSQVGVFTVRLGECERVLYCTPESLSDLRLFLEDIRTMPESEWLDVVDSVDSINQNHNGDNHV